ncbi:hypothetical protein SKA34_05375 [Photobacterium sp. SKA34]|nr:hypothetical protein SKA34_05375 [Photobacterium sp. SKA34]
MTAIIELHIFVNVFACSAITFGYIVAMRKSV